MGSQPEATPPVIKNAVVALDGQPFGRGPGVDGVRRDGQIRAARQRRMCLDDPALPDPERKSDTTRNGRRVAMPC